MEKKETRFQRAARKRTVLKNNGIKPSSEDRAMGQAGWAALEGMKDMSAMIWGGIPGVFIKNTPIVFWSGLAVSITGHYTGYRWLRRFGMGMMAVPVIQVASGLTGTTTKEETRERFKTYKESVLERFGIKNLLRNQESESKATGGSGSSITSMAGLGNVKYFNYQPNKNAIMSLNGNEVPGLEILSKFEEEYLQKARDFEKNMTVEQKRAAGIPISGFGEDDYTQPARTSQVLYGTIEERLL